MNYIGEVKLLLKLKRNLKNYMKNLNFDHNIILTNVKMKLKNMEMN